MISLPHSAPSQPLRLALWLGFAATGAGCAAPGALMPWWLARWALQDSQGGLLLFLFFVGNTLGALLSGRPLRAAIAAGCLLSAAGAVLLATAGRGASDGAILLFGTGLGLAMTSISLFCAESFGANRTAELTRLNLLWALGACLTPWLLLHRGVLDGSYAARALLVFAALFAVLALSVALAKSHAQGAATSPAASLPSAPLRLSVPFALVLLVFCATGIESASGSWLATYTQRGGHSLGVTIGASTALWGGLLLSRLLHCRARWGRALQPLLLSWNLGLLTLALVGLIALRGGVPLLVAAFVIGFTAGPMYPLLLSLVLERSQGNRIFVIAGAGAASLPLLTGALSRAEGSLRVGLAVPLLAALCMWAAGSLFLHNGTLQPISALGESS